ncbi:MAG: peptidyl-prolyl cis-trans isomerase [Myxococcota bacterium]
MRSKALLSLLGCLGAMTVAVAFAQGTGGDGAKDDAARRAQVLVEAGDVKVTVGEVEDAINAQSPFLRARYEDPGKLREFVDDMVRFELLAKEAERRGYGEHDAVVRTVKQNAVQQLIRREFDEKITPKSISEDDVRQYYEAHREEFQRPAMARASHILVGSKERARELLKEAREADVRAFRQLAREHSTDTETKHRGGDLRYFTQEGRPPGSRDAPVAPELVQAAFALEEVGDVVAAPVEVGDNYSILMLTGRRPAEEKSLEDAEQSIRLRLWRQRRQEAVEQFVDSLREKHEPEIHPDRMRPIQLDTAATSPGFPGHEHGRPGEDEATTEGAGAGAGTKAAEGDVPGAP